MAKLSVTPNPFPVGPGLFVLRTDGAPDKKLAVMSTPAGALPEYVTLISGKGTLKYPAELSVATFRDISGECQPVTVTINKPTPPPAAKV